MPETSPTADPIDALLAVLKEFPNDDWDGAPEQEFVPIDGETFAIVPEELYRRFLDAFNAYQAEAQAEWDEVQKVERQRY